MRRAVALAAGFCAGLGLAPAQAAPPADLHEIKWFVHVDLIDAGAGRDLAFYEAMLDEALADGRELLEGHQGPADRVCCSRLLKEEHSPGVTLTTFGAPGDGLDVIDAGETAVIAGIGGSGSRGFLVDSINDCGGSPAIGCATQPACGGPPDDDPTYELIVTLDAQDSGVLGLVVAHERGHNACLPHVVADSCELMRAAVSGGCLSASECESFADARQSSGDACACHADVATGSDPEPIDDAIPCADSGGSGVCSGGVCAAAAGDASVALFAAGGPESESGASPDDALRHSGLPGGWSDVGDLGGNVRGLAWDPDAEVLYAIADGGGGDDSLVTLDPDTGAVTATIGTLTGYDEITSLAFDPGPTAGPSDDRLLALASDGAFEDLIEIDPVDASPSLLAGLSDGVVGGFQGLAYDSQNQALYAAGFSLDGLWEIDVASCGNPGFCTTSEVAGIGITRQEPSLAYSRATGSLYQVGRQSGPRILYNRIDADTLATSPTIGIDGYTPGGLAALPAPEPATGWMAPAGAGLVALLARRRARLRGR
jgi:hypothetical protein